MRSFSISSCTARPGTAAGHVPTAARSAAACASTKYGPGSARVCAYNVRFGRVCDRVTGPRYKVLRLSCAYCGYPKFSRRTQILSYFGLEVRRNSSERIVAASGDATRQPRLELGRYGTKLTKMCRIQDLPNAVVRMKILWKMAFVSMLYCVYSM